MRRLIINADDFGVTDGVSAGIADCLGAGAVTSTTIMAAVPGVFARIACRAETLSGHAGVHLQLTGGRPLVPAERIPTLVEPDGWFPRPRDWSLPVSSREILAEWRAQLDLVRKAGIEPTHLDGHHHCHAAPQAWDALRELALEECLPVRPKGMEMRERLRRAGIACPDVCVTAWYGQGLTPERLLGLVDEAFSALGGEGTVEVMCHPGHPDADLATVSEYVAERGEELAALTSPACRAGFAARGLELVSYAALRADGA